MEEYELPEWAKRVQEEYNELSEKLTRLEAFQATAEFERLDPDQSDLLLIQCDLMRAYSRILLKRLELA